VHEFGHFHNFFHVEDAVYYAPLDTAEIFSQALELMVMPQYREFLPEDVAYELYCNLLDACFDILVYQSYIAAMELNMYALAEEELTVENLERIAMEQAVAFCLVEPEEQESQKRSWVQILHMFVVPLYTFSYATSMDVSLQIWERYLEDPGAAMEAYHQMMLREDQTAYFENLEAAGLSSPFAPGRMQKLTELLERYLVEEELEDVFFEE